MDRVLIGAVVLAAVCLCLVSQPAAACPDYLYTWKRGPVEAVAVSGTLVYFGSGTTLLIADITDPTQPRILGELDLPGTIEGLTALEDHVYVAASTAGLRVVDVTPPTYPFEVGHLDTPGSALDVAVVGDYAYVADDTGGLRVVNVSSVTTPAAVGSLDLAASVSGVEVAGNRAFVAAASRGLRVVDVSAPAAPVEVGFFDTDGTALDVALLGSTLYLADGTNGIYAFDVTNPAPQYLYWHDTPGQAQGLAVEGGLLFIADGIQGLRLFDVSDPTAPAPLSALATSDTGAVAASGDLVGLANGNNGLVVVDVSTPTSPTIAGGYGFATSSIDEGMLAVTDQYVYVQDHSGTSATAVLVLQFRAPLALVEVGRLPPAGSSALAAQGNLAYLVSSESPDTLRVFSVDGQTGPAELGSTALPHSYALDMVIADDRLFILHWNSLEVLDVSVPSVPVVVADATAFGASGEMEVSGNVAYIATTSGLQLVNVSDPAAMSELAFWPVSGTPPSEYVDVDVEGDRAYFQSAALIEVIDVSEPSQPQLLGFYNLAEIGIEAFDVEGSLGFFFGSCAITDYFFCLAAVDFSDPAFPELVGSTLFDLSFDPERELAVRNGMVFLPSSSPPEGLHLFDSCGAVLFADGFEIGSTYFWD